MLLQKHRDTNGSRIVMQIGGVCATFCQEEGILLQKHRDRNGRCVAIPFTSIGVRGRFDAPDCCLEFGGPSKREHLTGGEYLLPKFMPISFVGRVSISFLRHFRTPGTPIGKIPAYYWHATLSCPSMASNYANLYLVPISF